jgi:hypothetical protein
MSRSGSNCLVCILQLKWDPFRFMFPIRGYCRHLKHSYSHLAYFEIVKIKQILVLFFAIVEMAIGASYFVFMPTMCKGEKSDCLNFVGDAVFLLTANILGLVIFFHLKVEVQEMHGWLKFLQNRRFFGLTTVVSNRAFKKIKSQRYISVAVICLDCAIIGFFLFQFSHDSLPYNTFRKFSIACAVSLQTYALLDIIQRITLVGLFLNAFKKLLCSTLRRKSNMGKILKRTSLFIFRINENLKLTMEYFMLAFIVWSLTTIASLILNIYVVMKFSDYDVYALVELELRTGTTIIGILIIAVCSEHNLQEKVSRY